MAEHTQPQSAAQPPHANDSDEGSDGGDSDQSDHGYKNEDFNLKYSNSAQRAKNGLKKFLKSKEATDIGAGVAVVDGYLPIVEPAATSAPCKGSHMFGQAWLNAGVNIPPCPNCLVSMQLWAQFDVASLPKAAQALLRGITNHTSTGYIQVFRCPELGDDGYEGTTEIFVRYTASLTGSESQASKEFYPAQDIKGWREVKEVHCGLLPNGGWFKGYCATGLDKLLGGPLIVADIPECPKCSDKMSFFMQLGSHNKADFGDNGVGQVWICPEDGTTLCKHMHEC